MGAAACAGSRLASPWCARRGQLPAGAAQHAARSVLNSRGLVFAARAERSGIALQRPGVVSRFDPGGPAPGGADLAAGRAWLAPPAPVRVATPPPAGSPVAGPTEQASVTVERRSCRAATGSDLIILAAADPRRIPSTTACSPSTRGMPVDSVSLPALAARESGPVRSIGVSSTGIRPMPLGALKNENRWHLLDRS